MPFVMLTFSYLNINKNCIIFCVAEVQPKFFQPKLMYNDVIPSNELESWDNPTAPSFSSEVMLAKANYMT